MELLCEVAQTPMVGKLFEIDVSRIDRSRFQEPRKDWSQEDRRRTILDSFDMVDKNAEKYACKFYTLIPEKNWIGGKKVSELEAYAKDLGGLMADWVEQALEWAQRISNGESWEDICKKHDAIHLHRVVLWRDGDYRRVGGFGSTVSYVFGTNIKCFTTMNDAVPLITIK